MTTKLITTKRATIAAGILAIVTTTTYMTTGTKPQKAPKDQTTLFISDLRDSFPSTIPGSLRWAIAIAEPNSKIVFNIGGEIHLVADLRIKTPGITIDGSTAKGGGITITGHQVSICNTSGVRLRHLRMRSGDGYVSEAERKKVHGEHDSYIGVPGRKDSQDTGGVRSLVVFTENGGKCSDIVVENCSIENSTDDNGAVWGDCRGVVFRECIFAGGYAKVYRGDKAIDNSKGFISGNDPGLPVMDYPDYLTLDRCLFANVAGRAPDISGGNARVVNCVIATGIYGNLVTNAKADIIGNYLLSMPNHPWTVPDRIFTADPAKAKPGAYYFADNWLDGKGVSPSIGVSGKGLMQLPAEYYRSSPWTAPTKDRILSATEAMKDVLLNAGCTKPVRDKADQAVIDSVASQISK
jgi:hypothetical protein